MASIASFALINADKDIVIQPLSSGATLNLATLPSRRLNVQALPSGSLPKNSSVRFTLDRRQHTEDGAPYALFSNNGQDFFAGSLAVGQHTLTATVYDGPYASGHHGATYSATFTVTDKAPPAVPAVTQFDVIDASTDKVVSTLTDGGTINLASFPIGHKLTVRADLSGAGKAGSVAFDLGGTQGLSRVENGAPYALFSNNGEDYFGGTLAPGGYTLSARAFGSAAGKGTPGTALSVRFTVTDVPLYAGTVSGVSLVDARTDSVLGPLDNQDFLSGDVLDLTALNVQAATTPGSVGSVEFFYDGTPYIRNAAPYALFGNNGNDFVSGTIAPGTHTLEIIPFQGPNATGAAGARKKLIFSAASAAGGSLDIRAIGVNGYGSVGALFDGAYVNVADEPNAQIVASGFPGTTVGSYSLSIDGEPVNVTNSNDLYDTRDTNLYSVAALTAGRHQAVVHGYSGPDGQGTAGKPLTLNFTVVTDPDAPSVGLTAVDTGNTSVTGFQAPVNTIIGDTATGSSRIAVYATDGFIGSNANSADRLPGSVVFELDGQVVKTVNADPADLAAGKFGAYSLFGSTSDGSGNPTYLPGPIAFGTHTIEAIPYSGPDATGVAGSGGRLSVTVDNPSTVNDVLLFTRRTADPAYPDFEAPDFASGAEITLYNPTNKPIALDGSLDLVTRFQKFYENGDTSGRAYLKPIDAEQSPADEFADVQVRTIYSAHYALVRTKVVVTESAGEFSYTFQALNDAGKATDQPYMLPAGQYIQLDQDFTTLYSIGGSGSPTKKGKSRTIRLGTANNR